MKIQICRASGLPIKESEIAAFNESHRQLYDKVKTKVLGTGTLMTSKEAARMQALLNRLAPKVLKAYTLVETITVSNSKKAWLELVAQHGPIALAKNGLTGDLAAVIMDSEFGG